MAEATTGTDPRLIDLCGPIVKELTRLDRLVAGGDPQAVRAVFEDAFAAMITAGKQAGKRLDEIEAAKYALVALVDERILSGEPGPVNEAWLSEPLQLKYYDEFTAGEEFYARLEILRAETGPKAEVLEVYHLALALGFAGKLADRRGQEQRQVLLDGLAKDLRTVLGEIVQEHPEQLSAAGPARFARRRGLARLPLWLVPVLVLAGLVALYVVLAAVEANRFQHLVQTFAGR